MERSSQSLLGEFRAKFAERSLPVPADLRPTWRVAEILSTLLLCGRSGSASFLKLHVLTWSATHRESRDGLSALLNGTAAPGTALFRFDPSLNRAVDLGVGLGLWTVAKGDRVQLTSEGVKLAETLVDQDFLGEEAAFLKSVGKPSEATIRKLAEAT